MTAVPVSPAARVARPEAALFASDMHMDDTLPALGERVLAQLDAAVAEAGREAGPEPVHLFLLGDLFEYWVGDDHLPAVANELASRLAGFVATGGRVFLMRGNRDFLIDVPLPGQPHVPAYASRCGATMLPDTAVVEVAGRRIALSHGDELCVHDTDYQQWRALCRSTAWQRELLARPVDERIAMARHLRSQSSGAQSMTETVSDVDERAASALLARLDAALLVHGHTHRPGRHRWPESDGAGTHERWVLSDWSADPPRGSVMSLAAGMAQPLA
jgi:UDP-2,3-diacylglucosamine hydrolase